MKTITKLLLICFALSFFSACKTNSHSKKLSHEKPNIIFIMADDMGYGEAGCYGQEIIKTPNIDKIAAEGMKFTQFYSGRKKPNHSFSGAKPNP